jgi:hypothetical protein
MSKTAMTENRLHHLAAMFPMVGLHLLPILKALSAHGASVAVLVLVLGLDMVAHCIARFKNFRAVGARNRL